MPAGEAVDKGRRAPLVQVVARVRALVQGFTLAVWQRDRTALGSAAGLANRAARLAIWIVRGIFRHRLSLQAAGLTYYTVFAIVPLLVVVLWIVKGLDAIPAVTLKLSVPDADPAGGNALLRSAARGILGSVERSSRNTSGILGLGALLYTVILMFSRFEKAIDVIASSKRRSPILFRVLGYLALLALPPVLLAISGAIAGLAHGKIWAAVLRVLGALPGLKVATGVVLVLAALWLGLSIFYTAAARAHLTFRSAALGGALGAVLLAGVLWAFARFQIGVTKASAFYSGMAALPVFMLWTFSSWFVVLVGAELAVASAVDRATSRGTSAFHLDAAGAEVAGLALMIRAARADGAPVTVDRLSGDLRLLPRTVRRLCDRLAAHGLLVDTGLGGYRLGCDPRKTRLGSILVAVAHDPSLDGTRADLAAALGPRSRAALRRWAQAPRAADADLTLAVMVAEADEWASADRGAVANAPAADGEAAG